MKKYIALTAIGVLLSLAAHVYATAERGYEAIGGETLFILLPVMWWLAEQMVRDFIEDFRSAIVSEGNAVSKHARRADKHREGSA